MKSISKNQRAKRRKKLYDQSPYCPFCHVKTILPEDVVRNQGIPGVKTVIKPPRNMCTIEHLFSKANPLRTQKHRRPTTIICCYGCNQRRGHVENRSWQKKEAFIRYLDNPFSNMSHNLYNVHLPMQIKAAKIISIGVKLRQMLTLYFLLLSLWGFSQTPFYIMKPAFIELGDTTFMVQGASLKNTWVGSKLMLAISDDGLLRDNLVFAAKVLYVPLHGETWAVPVVGSVAPANKDVFVPESGLNLGIYPYKVLGFNQDLVTVLHGGLGYKAIPVDMPGEIPENQIKAMLGVEWLIYQKGFKAPATVSVTQNLWRNGDKNIWGLELTGILPVGVDLGILIEYYQPYGKSQGGARVGLIMTSK